MEKYDLWSPLMLALNRRQDSMRDALISHGARIGLVEALLMQDDAGVDVLLADGLPPVAPNHGSILAFARTPKTIDRLKAGTRKVRRKREQLYAARAPRMRLARALSEGAHPELMEAIVASLTRQMDRDFRTGMASPARLADGELRNLGFFRLMGRPDAHGMKRINACLAEIAEILWQAEDPDADLVCLSWVFAPL